LVEAIEERGAWVYFSSHIQFVQAQTHKKKKKKSSLPNHVLIVPAPTPFTMITPVFNVTQDDDYVTIVINAPHIKVNSMLHACTWLAFMVAPKKKSCKPDQ